MRRYLRFVWQCLSISFSGDWRYYTWMAVLTAVALLGLNAWCKQMVSGLITTGLTDHVSWGFYIANFTFLVGMAAAAVMLVIPVYIYRNRELRDLVIFGELLAVACIIMCLSFVTADLGRPDRALNLFRRPNFPDSIMVWDVIALNGYLLLNVHICSYMIYCAYLRQKPRRLFYIPFVFVAIVWAVSIHTVTAFLYVGLGSRPFWNTAIIAPRFLASAFAAGPAFLILTLQVIRKCTSYQVSDKALDLLRNIVTIALMINMFLLGCELFTEFYTESTHMVSTLYLYFGLHGHSALVPWIWSAIVLSCIALVILVTPAAHSFAWLNIACVFLFVGIWIEKGMGLIVPAFVPSPLGEMVEYTPTINEMLVCLGIWAFGILLFTIFVRITIPVLSGRLTADTTHSDRFPPPPSTQGDHPMKTERRTDTSKRLAPFALLAVSLPAVVCASLPAQAIGRAEMSKESKECIKCHRKEQRGLYQQWGRSKHFRGNVGCYECHGAGRGDKDAFDHYDHRIAVIVSPKDCARCHLKEVKEFQDSHHAKAARTLGSLDSLLGDVVAGNKGLVTPSFPQGVSAAAVGGCWQCHGSEVKVLADGRLDPATYPNSGVGRINPDGSEGACNACHSRHEFSAAQARFPDTCGKCHLGPDHSVKEIYHESKHGIAFFANVSKMNLDSAKWIAGEDYSSAPTCATCHMSATKNQPVTHNVGMRISWNNRPPVSLRPEVVDAKLGLPGAQVPWQVRRQNMKTVCVSCHAKNWVDGFYVQYDGVVDLYNRKYGSPGKVMYELAKPLRPHQTPFSHKIDWTWFEVWHRAGRRARHGASMMAPDYTYSRGLYDLAKIFYTQYIPQLTELAEQAAKDPGKREDAQALLKRITAVMDSNDHRWARDKMDPAEMARHKKAQDEFRKRYQK